MHRHPAPSAAAFDGAAAPGQRPWQRFERAAPNELWQMRLQGPLPLLRPQPLPSADRARRPFALLAGAQGLRRRARRDRAQRADQRLPPLWIAGRNADGQWRSLGLRPRPSLHRLQPVADPARHPRRSWSGLSPADPGQRRALPSNAQVRSSAATSTSPPSNTASTSSITFASATTWLRPHDALVLAYCPPVAPPPPSPIPFPDALAAGRVTLPGFERHAQGASRGLVYLYRGRRLSRQQGTCAGFPDRPAVKSISATSCREVLFCHPGGRLHRPRQPLLIPYSRKL